MERIPVRLWGLGAAAALAVMALAVFVLRAAGVPLQGVAAGEAAVYSALFAATALAVLRWALDGITVARVRQGMASTAALLLTLTFAAGLSADALTLLVCLLVTLALVGIDLFAGPARRPALDSEGIRGASQANSQIDVGSGVEAPADDALRLVRSVAEGVEHLEGRIRFETAAGETSRTLHVPLWPPLPASPSVACELEGIEGRVRVPFAKPHGFRIEVRLPEAVDEPLSGVVRFTAECPARTRAA